MFPCRAVETDVLLAYTVQGISNTVWAYATLAEQHPLLFDVLAWRLCQNDIWMELNAQGVANVLWAYARASHLQPGLLLALGYRLICQDGLVWQLKTQEVVTVLWSFGRMRILLPWVMPFLCSRALSLTHTMTAQHVSNVFYALGSLSVRHLELLDAVAQRALVVLEDLRAVAVANILYGAATVVYENPVLTDALCEHALQWEVLSTFWGHEIAHTLAGLVHRSGGAPPRIVDRLLHRALRSDVMATVAPQDAVLLLASLTRLQEAGSEEGLVPAVALALATRIAKPGYLDAALVDVVVQTVWCFAVLGVHQLATMGVLAARLLHPTCAENLTAQSVVSVAWAFAELQVSHPTLFEMLSKRAVELVDDMNIEECAAFLWSFAILRHRCPTGLTERILDLLPSPCEAEVLAKIVWALAVLNPSNAEEIARACGDAYAALESPPSGTNAAIMAWGLATLNVQHEGAVRIIAQVAVTDQTQLQAADAANICWALVRLGCAPVQLVELLARHALRDAKMCPAAGLSGLAWALYTSGLAPFLPQLMAVIATVTMEPEKAGAGNNIMFVLFPARHR